MYPLHTVCIDRKQGIQFRKKEEAVGGWFSQIGQLHVVHHLWGMYSISCDLKSCDRVCSVSVR